jgi:ADP-ribose pyrophosphatase YjhB (NUDIX family)
MENKIRYTKSAGGVVVNTKGQILIVSQRGTAWSLPKGHIEEEEDALDVAKREIYEESGVVELEFIKDLGNYQRFKMSKDGRGEDMSELKTIILFLFKTSQNILKPIDPENPEARWVEKSEVANLLTHPKDKEFFFQIAQEVQKLL